MSRNMLFKIGVPGDNDGVDTQNHRVLVHYNSASPSQRLGRSRWYVVYTSYTMLDGHKWLVSGGVLFIMVDLSTT